MTAWKKMPFNYNDTTLSEGAWVQCTDDYFEESLPRIIPNKPRRYSFYSIRELRFPSPDDIYPYPTILLNEVINPRVRLVNNRSIRLLEPGWRISRFIVITGPG